MTTARRGITWDAARKVAPALASAVQQDAERVARRIVVAGIWNLTAGMALGVAIGWVAAR